MDNSSSRRRFLQTLGLATGALAAGSFANAQEVAPLAPKKITIPDPNNIGPMTTWPPRKPGAIYMGGFRAPKPLSAWVNAVPCTWARWPL